MHKLSLAHSALIIVTCLVCFFTVVPTFADEHPKIITLDWVLSRHLLNIKFPQGWTEPVQCRMILSEQGKTCWEKTREITPPSGKNPYVSILWEKDLPYGLLTLRTKLVDRHGSLLDEQTTRCFRYLRSVEYPKTDPARKIAGNLEMKVHRGGIKVFDIRTNTEKTSQGWTSTMKGSIPLVLQAFMKKKSLFIQSKMIRLDNGLPAPVNWQSKWKGGTVSVDYDQKTGFISRKNPFVRTLPKSAYDYLSMIQALRRISFRKNGPPVVFLLDRFSARELTFGKEDWYIDAGGTTHKLIALVFRPVKVLPHSSGQLVRLEVSRLVSATKKKDYPGYRLDFEKTGAPIQFELGSFELLFEK